MAKTGPQKYPDASTAYWYQGDYPGSEMEVNVGLLHTTEGTSLPSYSGGSTAPNFTALPDIPNKRLRWYQHFDFDVSSRALRNESGGVETNTLNVVQVELVGTCVPDHKTSWGSRTAGEDYLFWPNAPDWALKELAEFVRWAHDEHGVKMQSTVTWKAYPGSYGDNGVRLSGSEWQNYYGWCGHQHAPENDHGDPGNIDMARVLEHAKEEDDDMALNDDDLQRIVEGVWKHTITHGGTTLRMSTRVARSQQNALDAENNAAEAVALLEAQKAAPRSVSAPRRATATSPGDVLTSLMRTLTPLITTGLLTVAAVLGLDLDSTTVTVAVYATMYAVYYTGLRLVETWATARGITWLATVAGTMLGWAVAPTYSGSS